MAISDKIFNLDVPTQGEYGQINYQEGQNLAFDGNSAYWLHTSLAPENEENLLLINDYPDTPDSELENYFWMYKGSKIRITGGYINNRGVNYSTKRSGFCVYMVDRDATSLQTSLNSGTNIATFLFGTSGHSSGADRANQCNDYDVDNSNTLVLSWPTSGGNSWHRTSGGDLGSIIGNSGGGNSYSRNWNDERLNDFPVLEEGSITVNDDLIMHTNNLNTPGHELIFIVMAMGNADDTGTQDYRNRGYNLFTLPKSSIRDMYLMGQQYKNDYDGGAYEVFGWGYSVGDSDSDGNNVTVRLGGTSANDHYTDNYGDGDEPSYRDTTASAYETKKFIVRIDAPVWNNSDIPDHYTWINEASPAQWWKLNPENRIDYIGLVKSDGDAFSENDIFDFRPVSKIYVPSGQTYEDIDIQSFYTEGTTDYFLASAPNEIRFDIDIARNLESTLINYINFDSESEEWIDDQGIYVGPAEIQFKYFVVDWDADSTEPWVWSDVVGQFPSSYTENETMTREKNSFVHTKMGNPLSHVYSTPGVKTIRAVVYSYIEHPLWPDHIQSLKWKGITASVSVNYNPNQLEDFGELGGVGYSYIPWPNTTPIVGGMSVRSQYYNTVKTIQREDKFSETELLEKYKLNTAVSILPNETSDELGRDVGSLDMGQIRYFKNSYNMNQLLKIHNDILTDGFHPYYDTDYWKGDPCVTGIVPEGSESYECTEDPTFPETNSLELIFIDDEEQKYLRDDCIIEFNPEELEINTIRDSSGNGNKAILLGDYDVKKLDFNSPAARGEAADLPELDDVEGPI